MPFNTTYYQTLNEFLTQNYYERAVKQLWRSSTSREYSDLLTRAGKKLMQDSESRVQFLSNGNMNTK